jgi:hypothetical protein
MRLQVQSDSSLVADRLKKKGISVSNSQPVIVRGLSDWLVPFFAVFDWLTR